MQQPVHLASIDTFSTDEIIMGDEVKLLGDGFVPGDVEILFDGKWKVGGEHPVSRTITLQGTALDESEISFVMERTQLEDFCAFHVFFQGKVVVRMKSSKGEEASYVDGSRDRLTFDILDMEPNGERVCTVEKGRIGAYLADAGFSVAEREDPGIEVTHVDPGKKAARAGVRQGDIIVVSGGMKIYSIDDLLPPPGTTSLSMALFRRGEGRLTGVTLPIKPRETSTGARRNIIIAAALCLIVVLLQSRRTGALLAKAQSLGAALSRKKKAGGGEPGKEGAAALEGDCAAEGDAGGKQRKGPPVTRRTVPSNSSGEKLVDRVTAVLFSMMVIFPFVTMVALVLVRHGERLHSAWACGAVFILAFTASFGESRAGGGLVSSVLRRLITGFFLTLPVILILTLRWLKTCSATLQAAGSEQMFYPWIWNGLLEPFSLILLLSALLSAAVPERRRTPWRRHLVMHLYSVLVISLAVLAMMGGFEAPRFVQAYPADKAQAVAVFIFMFKVLVVYFSLQAATCREEGGYSPSFLNASLITVAALLAFMASLMFAPVVAKKVDHLPYITSAAAFAILLLAALVSGSQQKSLSGHT